MAKGKTVAQWHASVMDESGEPKGQKLPITFTVSDGLFHIALPEYVTAFLGPAPKWPSYIDNDCERFYIHSESQVVAKTLDAVKARFDTVMKVYQDTLRDQGRRKVLLVHWNGESSDRPPAARSHSGFGREVPRLSLTYETLWEMGGKLYRVYERKNELPQMTYMRAVPDPKDAPRMQHGYRMGTGLYMLDWTEEREGFFRQMTEAMNTLIGRIDGLLDGDVTAKVDQLIASGGGLLALPAPAQGEGS